MSNNNWLESSGAKRPDITHQLGCECCGRDELYLEIVEDNFGDCPESAVMYLLADLMQYCELHGLDFGPLLVNAQEVMREQTVKLLRHGHGHLPANCINTEDN